MPEEPQHVIVVNRHHKVVVSFPPEEESDVVRVYGYAQIQLCRAILGVSLKENVNDVDF